MAKSLINELPPDGALAKHLPIFFEQYPETEGLTPSTFFLVSDKTDNAKMFLSDVCHANLCYEKANFWDQLITAVPKSDELSIAYIQMLIQGPFKGFSDLITLKRSEDFYYLHITDLDKWPANALYNFCIATRIPIEYNHYLPRWDQLVKLGFDKTLAFLLSYSTNGKDRANSYPQPRTFPNENHVWLDPSSSWKAILSGDMEKLSASYKDSPHLCRPCNVIWGKSQDWKEINGLTDEEVSQFYGLPIEPIKVPEAPKAKKKLGIDLYQQVQAQQAQQAADAMAQMPQHAPPAPNPAAEIPIGGPVFNFDLEADPWPNPPPIGQPIPIHHAPGFNPWVHINDAAFVPADLADDDDDDELDDDFWEPMEDLDNDF